MFKRGTEIIVSVSEHKYLFFSFLIKAILEHRFVNKSKDLTEGLLKQLRFRVSIENNKRLLDVSLTSLCQRSKVFVKF